MRCAPHLAVTLALGLGACSTTIGGDPEPAVADASVATPEVDAEPVIPDPEPDAAPIVAPCVEGNAQVSGDDETCYMLFNAPKDFDAAQAACLGLGATLVIVNDLEEQTLVGQLAGNAPLNTPDPWMGANDNAVEGSFVWLDGSPVVFANFREGEPNNSGPDGTDENCLIIEGDNPAREWDDRTCVALFPYICERAPG